LHEHGGKEAVAASLLSLAPACSLETAPRSTPASTYQQNWLASVGRVHSTHARPALLGPVSLVPVPQGLCPASCRVRASLWASVPLSAPPPLPKSAGSKGGPGCPRQAARPYTGRSPLLPSPWRSSLIQSQHNGAEMAPLILLGRLYSGD